jgi:hypothetical protein
MSIVVKNVVFLDLLMLKDLELQHQSGLLTIHVLQNCMLLPFLTILRIWLKNHIHLIRLPIKEPSPWVL